MTEVAPFDDDDRQRRPDQTSIPSGKSRVAVGGGLLYLVGSLSLSAVYLTELRPSVSNDYWWPDFNTTGLQTFVGDVYNIHLSQGRVGDFPLLNGTAYSTKSYSDTSGSRIEWSGSYSRQLLLDNIPLDSAVTTMRLASLAKNLMMTSFYCWVDLDRKFALSLTYKRHARCEATKRSNGAMYFETLARNCPSVDLTTSAYSAMFNATMFQTMRQSADGQRWVDMILTHKMVAVPDEVAHWTKNGIEYWKTGMQNLNQDGIDDSIQIENALGYRQSVRIKKLTTFGRGMGLWTTLFGFCGLWNIIDISQSLPASAILHANDSFVNLGIDWDADVLGLPETPGVRLVRKHIGPFLSFDMMLVAKPGQLSALLTAFQDRLGEALPSRQIPPPETLDVVPASWMARGRVFYGGNPVCPLGRPQPFIQPPFGYYDDCTAQVRHTVSLTLEATIFALHLLPPVTSDMQISICSLCPTTAAACLAMLRQVSAAEAGAIAKSARGTTAPTNVIATASALAIQFIQLASENGTEMLLRQPLVPVNQSDPWSFFGWIMVYDWLRDDREVYNFEGDEGNVTLMSQVIPRASIIANPMDLPQNACNYIWILSIYVSFALVGVGAILLAYAVSSRFQLSGVNLFRFNRVVGSVWIGRPMLFLRGMTALIVLSTSPVEFVSIGHVSTIQLHTRSIFASCLFAGEGAWVTYVVQDISLPVIQSFDALVPLSSIATWFVLFVFDVVAPIQATATIQRRCTISRLGLQIECESGVIQIGSVARLAVLAAISTGIPLLALVLARITSKLRAAGGERTVRLEGNQVLMPAAAFSFLAGNLKQEAATLVMCGMLPFRNAVFDIKLWRRFELEPPDTDHFDDAASHDRKLETFRAINKSKIGRASRYTVALAGLGYMIATVVGSYSYLVLTEFTMANDFWWEEFNATGHQSMIATWFNRHLLSFQSTDGVYVDKTSFGDTSLNYGTNQTQFTTEPLYSTQIQDEVNTLYGVVAGLRTMDSCLVPWISSSYCYVDLGRTWEIAVTSTRQERCKAESANGAVYLETLLRNVNWASLTECWGAALGVAIFDHVVSTPTGQQWLTSTRTNAKSVVEEVDHWRARGVATFTTQWQNYKKFGIVETVSIQNGFGLAYPITIKKQDKVFQLRLPTSFRLQWPLVNLLEAVASNSSAIGGMSLIRSSPTFAFQNATIEQVLIKNGTIPSPLGPGLALSRAALGPFGTTTLMRLAPPPELKSLVHELRAAVVDVLGTNLSALEEFTSIGEIGAWYPSPLTWKPLRHVGGNLMCEITGDVSPQVALGFMADGTCGTQAIDQLYMTKLMSVLGVLAMGPQTPTSLADICLSESTNAVKCKIMVPQYYEFLVKAIPAAKRDELAANAAATKRIIVSKYNPQLVQLTQNRSIVPRSTELSRLTLLDTEAFEYFSWMYMFGWVSASREVVLFQGDASGDVPMAIMSGGALLSFYQVNPQEIPRNVAFYLRSAMQYFTLVLLCVAVCVCLSIIVNRGYIEGVNMFEFNRVAGIVWIGRPLIVVRGVTAICILATSRLQLIRYGQLQYSRFNTIAPDFLTTILSSGEMGWFVYILNDLFSVVTHEYTTQYTWKSSILTWLAAAVWSLFVPVSHVVHVDRQCTLDVVDFASTCHSGTFEIGRFSRFVGLVVLAVGCCIVTYAVDRARLSIANHAKSHYSLLLHASAQHQFDRRHWELHRVYYLDQASAVLNGLIAIRTSQGKFIVMDVKTWRVFVVDKSKATVALPPALANAIPLEE